MFYLVRNDWHPPVDDMAITRHEECKENTQDRLQAHPLSNVIHFSFDAEHRLCDEDPLPGSFAGHLLRTLRFHIMLNMTDPSGKRGNYLGLGFFRNPGLSPHTPLTFLSQFGARG